MKLAKIVASALIVSSLGMGGATLGGAVATAQPGNGNGHGNGHDDGHGGRGNDCRPWCNGPGFDKHWDKGVWWADNRHDWWDDRQGPPPWGWGPPPPLQWNGGPLPQNVNYWGYNVSPVWDNGFRQWGIWLFGLWIPIFGVGFN